MTTLTSIERVARMLDRQPVDQVPVFEHFWGETADVWRQRGWLGKDQAPEDLFSLDMAINWSLNLAADPTEPDVVLEETAETKVVRNSNGATMRSFKTGHSSTPEHIDFLVRDFASWKQHVRPKLLDKSLYARRFDPKWYREAKKRAADRGQFFCWAGVLVFELMKDVCGHEHMLIGMLDEPEWIADMVEVYSNAIIEMQEILFAQEGKPDGIWFYEDMGFKGKPFMSPTLYKQLVWPAHKKALGYAHSLGLKTIVHSCGFVEPLVPGMIEAGMDCLQAIEAKAGMDLVHLKKTYGDRIAFMGGMDVRPLVANDRKAIQAELDAKLAIANAGGGYCLHTDHSIPPEVEPDTLRFFQNRAREMTRTTA